MEEKYLNWRENFIVKKNAEWREGWLVWSNGEIGEEGPQRMEMTVGGALSGEFLSLERGG